MKVIKRILLGLLILFLAASTIFVISYVADDRKRTFSEIVESGDLSNLHLTIYFVHSDFIESKLGITNLKRGFYDYKITVKRSFLKNHIDSLKELSKEPLIPYENEVNYLNYRIYYVFTTGLGYKLYDVAMWGYDDSKYCIFVNGVAVKESDIYYDVILPFLPQDAADELKGLVYDMRQW